MFVDEVTIYVCSGKGGDGMVHFHKEKYINRGGPDGGDGGRGGNVIIKVAANMNTLLAFRHKNKFIAENGKNGGTNNKSGKTAPDLIIPVPVGTMIFNESQNDLITDLVSPGQQILVARGGRGGKGNPHFANSRRQAPRIAEKGEPGTETNLRLELKLIADIGIVGMPNAGKSSFLAAITNARPKIADYPFTTLVPNLGVAQLDDQTTLILADIPGLIEGAHSGAGIGDAFLKHIQRTRVLIHLIDGLADEPFADYSQINTELALFDPQLAEKPQIVAFNKIDLPDAMEKWVSVRKKFDKHHIPIIKISTVTHENLVKVLWQAYDLLKKLPAEALKISEPVYRPGVKLSEFEINHLPNGWQIKGRAIERAAAMTYWEYDDSIRRFQRIMESMGIDQALREAGIKEGDNVIIGTHEFSWQD
jgi:GTP-binding protein